MNSWLSADQHERCVRADEFCGLVANQWLATLRVSRRRRSPTELSAVFGGVTSPAGMGVVESWSSRFASDRFAVTSFLHAAYDRCVIDRAVDIPELFIDQTALAVG
jgi:hypothetical protein